MSPAELAATIDHTLLKPEATAVQIDQLCAEAITHGFWSVCVNSAWVPRCVERLKGTSSRICAVVGFPLGAAATAAKAFETQLAVRQGATEIDMVVSLGALIAGDLRTVTDDIRGVVDAARSVNPAAIVKVILETRALSDDQIISGCKCAAEAGAIFVKTSTGFHATGGATLAHVALLKAHARHMHVKASGGIRDLAAALAMLNAGASRLGVSAGVAILGELASGGQSSSARTAATSSY